MEPAIVSEDYEVALPPEECERLGIGPGTQLQVIMKHGTIRLVPVLPLRELVGFVKGADMSDISNERDRY